ncbi:MAG TPA: hypothetical protein VME19_03510 [Streptosporangiaceae bacterium]|nr:hypothetical protein [Streptosporangiaceae bacterium]
MMARDRRYRTGRRSALKSRPVLATAVLACGAIAAGTIAAVAATGSGGAAGTAVSPAAYTARSGSEGAVLSSALSSWGNSRQAAYSELASLTQAPGYSQTRHQGQTLDIQRGIVVLATSEYLILQSANGSLHLWLLSDGTQFQDVAGTTAGTMALTASSSATQQAMASGNMIPATTLLAGSPVTAAALLTPATVPQTVSVQVANTDLTVTVTVTHGTAEVSQTATTPSTGTPTADETDFTQSAWQATDSVARGDLAVVVGMRSDQTLHAQLVLFTPLTTMAVGGRTGAVAGHHW